MAVTESDAVRVAREYREALANNEDAALRRLARYWLKMERELRLSYEGLYREIMEMQDAGEIVPEEVWMDLERYRDMNRQIIELSGRYEDQALDTITEYQRLDYNLGLDSASAILQASSKYAEIWNRVDPSLVETVAGFAGNGAPLRTLLQTDFGSLSSGILDALVSGVGLGKGAYATAEDMLKVTQKLTYTRAVRIARTEINRAYRIANAQQYAASGVVTKVLRLCYAPTACLACLEMDGEECPNGMCDDHPNGKCTTIAVTIGGHYPEWQRGHDWLMEQTPEDQRRIMGPGRYEMWRAGMPIRKMVKMEPNDVWGGSPTVVPEYELKKNMDGLE